MRLLLVDDEKQLVAGLCDGLEAQGFAVDVALDGLDGQGLARRNRYDADQVDLIDAGADDHLSKPWSASPWRWRRPRSWPSPSSRPPISSS